MADGITIADEVACVRREIGYRRRVYARRVAAGSMTQAQADRETRVMEAVLERLEKVEADGRLI